jgi:hypothetical protein
MLVAALGIAFGTPALAELTPTSVMKSSGFD